MGVIRHERPSITGSMGFGQESSKPFQKAFPITLIHKDRPSLYPPNDDMVKDARSVYT